jgi:xylulokinase
MYLAGIDLGTTGCKSMVFDHDGGIAGSYYIEYDLIFTPDGVEQDAELWWEHAKTALREAVRNAGIRGEELKAIAVASQGIASVPVDGEGKPLARAISWYDTRAQEEAAEIALQFGASYLFETTGRRASSLFFPQVLRIKRKNPALYEKARFFLMAHDYLVYRLCGAAVTDYTMASGTLCFDTGRHQWLNEMFDHYGIDRAKFPALQCFGTTAGKILPSVAAELGLSKETVIGVGMQDQKAAAMGAGITSEPGVMTLSLGTAGAISCLSPEKRIDKTGRLNCHAFDNSRWITENYVGASGSSLKWLRNTLFPNKPYPELDEMAGNSGAGSGGVFFNPSLDANCGSFSGLSLTTGAGDMVRAVLEGIAYSVRNCVEIQKEVTNTHVRELRVFGGGAGSGLWCQILSDVLNIPAALPRTKECTNLGAAICAGLSMGIFPGEAAIANFTGEISRRFEPDPVNARIYEEGYKKFCASVSQ